MRIQLSCPHLPAFNQDDWDEIARVFEASLSRTLGQTWKDGPDPTFEPATAHFGWRDTTMWLYVELHDNDISTTATGPNQAMWELGDTLELFLKPPGGETYYEFHVTPGNHQLQLRFPDALALKSQGSWTRFHVHEPLIQSQVLVESERNLWRVLLSLDRSNLDWNADTKGNALFSVSRYDYTRGSEKPVLSSTSPHQKPRPWFHDQQYWSELVFIDEK